MRKLPGSRRPSHGTVVAYLALFVALGGTSAWAANEWTGANIVDESLTGADVRGKQGTSTTSAVNGSLSTQDLVGQQPNPANGTPFIDGSLTQWDIRNNSLSADDLGPNSVNTSEVADNSLGGADILESGLGPVASAERVGDVPGSQVTAREVNYRVVSEPNSEDVILILGGLRLKTHCNPTDHERPGLNLFAESTLPDADILAYTVDVLDPDTPGTPIENPIALNPWSGVKIALLPDDKTTQAGHIVYSTLGGSVVTVQYRADLTFDGTDFNCSVYGHAFQS